MLISSLYQLPFLDFLAELVSALYNTSILLQWKNLGFKLHLSVNSLYVIERKHRGDTHMCLVEMLALWLRSTVDPPPSWNTVIDAIRFLGNQTLADELTAKCLTGMAVVLKS